MYEADDTVSLQGLFHGKRSADWEYLLKKTTDVAAAHSIITQLNAAMAKHGIRCLSGSTSCVEDPTARKIDPQGCGATIHNCKNHTWYLFPCNHVQRASIVEAKSGPDKRMLWNFCHGGMAYTGPKDLPNYFKSVQQKIEDNNKRFFQQEKWPNCVGCGISARLCVAVRIFLDKEGNRLALCENCVLSTTLFTMARSNYHTVETAPPPPEDKTAPAPNTVAETAPSSSTS
jgi:hypothetical protein